MNVDYPTLLFFEVGEWWDYLMLAIVIFGLAFGAWLAQRSKWFAITTFIVVPILLTVFWLALLHCRNPFSWLVRNS